MRPFKYTRDEVIAFFAQHEKLHPNGPVAVMEAAAFYGVEPIVIKTTNGNRYAVAYVDDDESPQAVFTIERLLTKGPVV
jgi:hypothetical protein